MYFRSLYLFLMIFRVHFPLQISFLLLLHILVVFSFLINLSSLQLFFPYVGFLEVYKNIYILAFRMAREKGEKNFLDFSCPTSIVSSVFPCAHNISSPLHRVNGVRNLYIADASVFPTMPSANTQALTVLTGQKLARYLQYLAFTERLSCPRKFVWYAKCCLLESR